MKTLSLLLVSLFLLAGTGLFSQVAVNTDGSAADQSAMLDVKSTNSGVLVPRMTASERDAIPSPATGLLVYVSDTDLFYSRQGTRSINLPHQ